LRKISETSQALVTKARAGRLSSAEMQGSVLTISNLGAYGIEVFTPILNENEVAIIGIGAIRSVAGVLSDDRIATRRIVSLCLTFDHAAVDGAPAAAFLRDVGSLIARACTLV
jgi:pyruvate dehydrogenase E2 component (dihydrolipoamide acetyltransferase)